MKNNLQFYGVKQVEIKHLSDQELLSQTKVLVQKERDIHIQVLHHLKEIESRKLYFSQGFSSLFDYAVKELGYSEGAAYRRIKAMRLCRDIPETEARLQSGRLSLSSACQLQNFFEKQAKKVKEHKPSYGVLKETGSSLQGDSIKDSEKSVSFIEDSKMDGAEGKSFQGNLKNPSFSPSAFPEDESVSPLSMRQKQNLMERVEGCSTREMTKLLSKEDPSLFVPREQARFLGENRVEIKMVIDEESYSQLEELKNLLSHRNPELSYGRLLKILVDERLKKQPLYRKEKRNPEKNITPLQEKASTSAPKLDQNKGELVTSAPKLGKSDGILATSAPKLEKNDDISRSKVALGLKNSVTLYNDSPNTEKSQNKKLIQRAIPAKIRKDIWARDQGRCTYVNPKTGRRCNSKYLLQVDHIKPFALGGGSEKENLRLLCAGHNRFRSEQTFFKNRK